MSGDAVDLTLNVLLARSKQLYSAWQMALEVAWADEPVEIDLRERLTLDACALAVEHGSALRSLMSSGLESSALALLRVQHEALLRAAWVLFSASEEAVRSLAAPHTPETLKQANKLPLTNVLLEAVEKSDAPGGLKRGLREFRERSWAGMNSYAHAGLLALGRVANGHPEFQLVQAIQVSNAHSYAAHMLCAQITGSEQAVGEINVIAVAFPGCMLRA